MGRVKVRYNQKAIFDLQSEVSDELAHRAARVVQAKIRARAPRDTGRLADSFEITRVERGVKTTYRVASSLNYAVYQNDGTGPIYPSRKGGVLAFTPKGSSVVVFARRTRGVPATHYLDEVYRSIDESDFTG